MSTVTQCLPLFISNLKMSPDMARANCEGREGEYAGLVFTNNKLAATFLNIKMIH